MHIPTLPTSQLEILTFAQALKQAEAPHPDYDAERWLYLPGVYTDYRYILGTRGRHPLICVGINPSTAAPGALDNTLKSVERIAHGNGFDSFVMFNVYAQRATRPQDMDPVCNPLLHRENMAAFRWLLARAGESPAIWAAWGSIIEVRPYLPGCLAGMAAIAGEMGARWYSAGARTKKGHPHHPLYLKKDSVLEAFPLDSYLQSLGT